MWIRDLLLWLFVRPVFGNKSCWRRADLIPPRWGIYPLLGGLCTVVGGGFSVRQLWLQSLPADQVPACGPDLTYMLEVFPLSEVLAAMTSGTGDCAEVSWSLLGFSIPGWLLLCFMALLAMNVMQIRQGSRA